MYTHINLDLKINLMKFTKNFEILLKFEKFCLDFNFFLLIELPCLKKTAKILDSH